jgi:DNA polymerase-3 subunit chi
LNEVAFYQLKTTPLERALPKLLEKALDSGYRVLVLGNVAERIEALDAALWTYDPASFLPHGTAKDGNAARQPIYLTTVEENPNGAQVLMLIDGAEPGFLGDFARCLDLFDGRDESALAAARRRYQALKAKGHALSYWEQIEGGRWTRRV